MLAPWFEGFGFLNSLRLPFPETGKIAGLAMYSGIHLSVERFWVQTLTAFLEQDASPLLAFPSMLRNSCPVAFDKASASEMTAQIFSLIRPNHFDFHSDCTEEPEQVWRGHTVTNKVVSRSTSTQGQWAHLTMKPLFRCLMGLHGDHRGKPKLAPTKYFLTNP